MYLSLHYQTALVLHRDLQTKQGIAGQSPRGSNPRCTWIGIRLAKAQIVTLKKRKTELFGSIKWKFVKQRIP
jgi:hypothetical protein